MPKHTLFSGLIRHRRFKPNEHDFSYKLYMFCFDLDHLDFLFNLWPVTSIRQFGLGWFNRKDFMGPPAQSLKDYVLDQVCAELGFRPQGQVTLLTHIRLWGVLMNPIALFCCYSEKGELQALVLQVTNTPWGERCLYVLKADPGAQKQHFEFKKVMHVSPFHPMAMKYKCHYMLKDNQLVFHLENHQDNHCITDATLVMRGQKLDRRKLVQTVFFHPFMTSKVYFGIYKQALVLYLKQNPIFNHPSRLVKQNKYSQGTR